MILSEFEFQMYYHGRIALSKPVFAWVEGEDGLPEQSPGQVPGWTSAGSGALWEPVYESCQPVYRWDLGCRFLLIFSEFSLFLVYLSFCCRVFVHVEIEDIWYRPNFGIIYSGLINWIHGVHTEKVERIPDQMEIVDTISCVTYYHGSLPRASLTGGSLSAYVHM